MRVWKQMIGMVGLTACVEGSSALRHPPDDSDSVGLDTVIATEPEDSDVVPTAPETVVVSHPREMRAVWVATVQNINFPSRTGLSAGALRSELKNIVDITQRAGLNAIVMQVRPEGDALYHSELEPWSRYLTGSQGGDPGLDPLAELIAEAHPKHIEVHAWLNPYRAKASASSTAVSPHISKIYPEYCYTYAGKLWMDPGSPEVRERAIDVVTDLVSRYAIDGIHFDDYFYPYPDGTEFPDAATYAASGTTLSKSDWRRQNVDRFVEDVRDALDATAPWVRYGIAPFGIYRPGQPPGITGLDQYTALFADPMVWMDNDWLDYMAPQLYWSHDNPGQEFGKLMEWWGDNVDAEYAWPGLNFSSLGESDFPLAEFELQTQLSRDEVGEGESGQLWYSIAPLLDDRLGSIDWMRDTLYPEPADSPPIRALAGPAVEPTVVVEGASVKVSYSGATPLRSYQVYRDEAGSWVWQDRVEAGATTIALDSGRYGISALDRAGRESLGVVVEIP